MCAGQVGPIWLILELPPPTTTTESLTNKWNMISKSLQVTVVENKQLDIHTRDSITSLTDGLKFCLIIMMSHTKNWFCTKCYKFHHQKFRFMGSHKCRYGQVTITPHKRAPAWMSTLSSRGCTIIVFVAVKIFLHSLCCFRDETEGDHYWHTRVTLLISQQSGLHRHMLRCLYRLFW